MDCMEHPWTQILVTVDLKFKCKCLYFTWEHPHSKANLSQQIEPRLLCRAGPP